MVVILVNQLLKSKVAHRHKQDKSGIAEFYSFGFYPNYRKSTRTPMV